jgi:hypothetical protein
MPQVMECQTLTPAALQTRSNACEMESGRMLHTFRPRRRDSPSKTACATLESGTHPGCPGLGFGDQEYVRFAIDVLPTWGRDLPAAHGGLARPSDEEAYLPTVSPGGCQKAGLLVADQTSVAARGQAGFLGKFCGVIQPLHAPSAYGSR